MWQFCEAQQSECNPGEEEGHQHCSVDKVLEEAFDEARLVSIEGMCGWRAALDSDGGLGSQGVVYAENVECVCALAPILTLSFGAPCTEDRMATLQSFRAPLRA